MRAQCLIWALLSLVGCTSLLRPKPLNSEHAKEVPQWAFAPMDECSEALQLCSSGEGETAGKADAHALKSLAAIFETKITGTAESTMIVRGSSVLAQAQETAVVNVRDEVKQTLEAAQIIKRHRYKKLNYSLASLDKTKASANLLAAMEKVQSELSALWQRRDRLAWARMWELFHQREGLNDRYTILNGTRQSFIPTAQELQAWYQSRRAEVPLALEAVGLPSEFSGALKARLTNSGYRVFDLNTGARLKAVWEAKKEHLNVEGFEKWFFLLRIENLSKAGAKVGALSESIAVTGRSRVDCEAKAREALIGLMESKLSELNLQD